MSQQGHKTFPTLDQLLGRAAGPANAVRQSPEEIAHNMRRWSLAIAMAAAKPTGL